jgi:hypothetical protein
LLWLRVLIPILGLIVASLAWDARFKREPRLDHGGQTRARIVFVVTLHLIALSILAGAALDPGPEGPSDPRKGPQTGEGGLRACFSKIALLQTEVDGLKNSLQPFVDSAEELFPGIGPEEQLKRLRLKLLVPNDSDASTRP